MHEVPSLEIFFREGPDLLVECYDGVVRSHLSRRGEKCIELPPRKKLRWGLQSEVLRKTSRVEYPLFLFGFHRADGLSCNRPPPV